MNGTQYVSPALKTFSAATPQIASPWLIRVSTRAGNDGYLPDTPPLFASALF
mgnify:FL=1